MPSMDDKLRVLMQEVPSAYADRFMQLIERIDAFCAAHLNDEYHWLCRTMAMTVCQEGAPVRSGKPDGWAAGVVYSVGRVNFLDDPSQSPHMKSKEIAQGFGVSVSNMQAKSRIICEGLQLVPLDPNWSLPSRMDDNPLVWMLSVNGVMVDIRDAPREAQVTAYEEGLIPYIPADREAQDEPAARTGPTMRADQETKLFELQVALIHGPMSEAFVNENPKVLRTIQVRGDQTLEELHEAIFDAFDRYDEHMYEFQVGGKGPRDRNARRYGLSLDDDFDEYDMTGDVRDITIGTLGLKIDEPFGYWFDFGDDWWHQVAVLAIHDKVPRGRYPKVTKRVGKSPPQYPYFD